MVGHGILLHKAMLQTQSPPDGHTWFHFQDMSRWLFTLCGSLGRYLWHTTFTHFESSGLVINQTVKGGFRLRNQEEDYIREKPSAEEERMTVESDRRSDEKEKQELEGSVEEVKSD